MALSAVMPPWTLRYTTPLSTCETCNAPSMWLVQIREPGAAVAFPRFGVRVGVGGCAMCVAVGEVALLAAVDPLLLPIFLSVGSLDCLLVLPVVEASEEEIEAALLTSSTVALVSSVTIMTKETIRAGRECAAARQSKRARSRHHPIHRFQRFIMCSPFLQCT